MSSTAKEVVWLRWLLMDLGVSITTSTPLYGDNQSAIKIASRQSGFSRADELEVALHFVRHHYLTGTLSLSYIASTQQIADFFTKAHTVSRFKFLIGKLSVHDPP